MTDLYAEGLEESLSKVYKEFDKVANNLGIRYSIVVDERDLQAYEVKKFDPKKLPELRDKVEVAAQKNGVVMKYEEEHRDGPLFTFSLGVIVDKKKKVEEDQYKYGPRKHVRDQSVFPSSFNPSVSFGGVGRKKFKEDLDKALENLTEGKLTARSNNLFGIPTKEKLIKQVKTLATSPRRTGGPIKPSEYAMKRAEECERGGRDDLANMYLEVAEHYTELGE